MGKMIMLFCLIAGTGKGTLKPDLISVDLVGIQAGFPLFYTLPGVGGYLGRLNVYWEDESHAAFCAGLELAHGALWYYFVSVGSIMPRMGIAVLGKPRPTMRAQSITYLQNERFRPRFELTSGVSFLPALKNYPSPVVRTDLRWLPLRFLSIQLQHYYFHDEWGGIHGLSLSVGINIGWDLVNQGKKEED